MSASGKDPRDARETELGSASGGLELFVRCVNDRTCFVALPRSVADAVSRRNPRIPLPLALASRKHARASVPVSVPDGADASCAPRSAPSPPAPSAPAFVAWAGAVGQIEGVVEVPLALADCLGLCDGDAVRVSGRPSAPTASFVNLRPETQRDWDAVVAAAEEIETSALRQVGCVAVGQSFPFWPRDSVAERPGRDARDARDAEENERRRAGGVGVGPLRVVATAASPSAPGGVARLGLETELRVAPWTSTTNTATSHAPREAAATAAYAPATPAMLRVQSSRGAVVAWPRRLRGAHAQGDDAGAAAVSAAPTAAAFISARTSRALGIEDGSIVEVSTRRIEQTRRLGGEASSPPGSGSAKATASSATEALTLRATAVDAAAVADGHVVLTRAVRDALGVGQGDRVFVWELGEASLALDREEAIVSVTDDGAFATESPPEEPTPPAIPTLRLRPVRSGARLATTGERSERPAPNDDDNFARFLEPAHRAALGVPLEADRAAVDAAAARLTMRWIKTQASFFGKGGDARRVVPVRTGTLFRFSLVAPNASSSSEKTEPTDATATFAVETRDTLGRAVALFDADELFGDEALEDEIATDSEDSEAFAREARVTLGPPAEASPARAMAVAGTPRGRNALVSKLFGDAVATHPPLDARREPALDAQAATAVAFATARLKAALRGGEIRVRTAGDAGDDSATMSIRPPNAGGALFWGAPGSGRTAAANETARRLRDDADVRAAVVSVDCARIPAQGDARPAVAALRRAAEEASRRAPAVVVLDDLDAVCDVESASRELGGEPEGGAESAPPPAAIVAEALGDLMDATSGRGGAAAAVAWIATARDPRRLAEATRSAGRFDHEAELKAPEALAGRVNALASAAAARGTPIADAHNLAAVARGAEGYARSDFDALVERAASEAASGWFREEKESARRGTLVAADLVAARRDFVPAPERALGGRRAREDDRSDDPGGARADDALESVGGLARAKAALEEALAFPSRHPSVFKNAPLRLRTGALLYGPPGCGKTLLARAAVRASGLRLIAVKGPELLNKYIGQSEAGVRAAFRRAASAAPCALFFDEFDAIAPRRGHDTTGVTDRVVNAFLTELDGVESLEGVVVLAATSRPDLVDPALLRPGRLDRMLPCPFPAEEEREAILRALAGTNASSETDPDPLGLVAVAARTEGFSGADLRGILSDAALFAERRGVAERETAEDVSRAAATARASVSAGERRKLEAVYAAFAGKKSDARDASFAEAPKRIAHA